MQLLCDTKYSGCFIVTFLKNLSTSSTSLYYNTYGSVCLCRLNFDNSAYRYIMKEDEEEQEILPITSDFFFEVFPFNIVFRQVIPLTLLSLGAVNV